MRLPRFFKPSGDERPADAAPANGAADDQDDADEMPAEMPDATWAERARAVLPMGTSTGSKRHEALWGTADVEAPTHYLRANGCIVTTTDDHELIDCTMALGAVAFGYADETVTGHVVQAAAHGNVAGLPHALEVEAAEMFCELVPCAERVQFLKSGAEAVAAAVRIARTHTGRAKIVGSGYFGWLDWCSSAEGVPDAVRDGFRAVPFDDIGALRAAVDAAGDDLAAIVLEPVVEREASAEWLAAARTMATDRGAALIFDEVKTGFRMATGGYQQVCGVTPDLAAFGKAMANGYPLSAVCGRADIMDAVRRTWISSTLACDTTALAAARAVMQAHAERDVCAELASIGRALKAAVGSAIRASRVAGIEVHGPDQMWFLTFESPEMETRFLVAAAGNGVLFKRGPYNFPALAHDAAVIDEIESRTSNALVAMREGH
jgi:glutamate-1-semialdehyde 2,1-aminomutase